MSTATEREFRNDPSGTSRLVAAPGDPDVAAEAVAAAPPGVTEGVANYAPAPVIDKLAGGTPPVAAGADGTRNVGEVKRAGTVSGVTYIPDATITGAATNNRRIRLINKAQDGTGTTIVAELAFGNGTNAAASDEKALTLSATAANLAVAAGDVLAFESTHIGTGIADPGGLAQVEISPTLS